MKKLFKLLRLLLFLLILFIIIIIIYGKYLGTDGLLLKEYDVISNKIPNSFNNKKIAHFGDILYNDKDDLKFFDLLLEKINSKEVDIIVFTGGLIDKNHKYKDTEINDIIDRLNKLSAKYGKYYITSKVDKSNKSYDKIMQESGFISLDNNNITLLSENNEKILLCGLNYSPDINKLNELNKGSETIYKIIMFHESNNIDNINDLNINLVLSSNYLYNQINIPLIKRLFAVDYNKKYNKTHFEKYDYEVFLTSGIGTRKINYRIFNKPSYNIYTLKNM